MKMIDIETLISEINAKGRKKAIIEFEGIITTRKIIGTIEINENKDNINLIDKDVKEEKIQLSKHQIMKIEKTKDEYILKFDTLQNVKIKEQI